MPKTIYIYTAPIFKEKSLYKVGESKIDAGSPRDSAIRRIAQQDLTANPEKLEYVWSIYVPESITDRQIHAFIENKGFLRVRSGREWFEIDIDELITLINEYVFGTAALNNYEMRDEQKNAHDKIVAYFTETCNLDKAEFLLAAKMRFGKNFTLLNAIKTLNCKNVLVLTYKPWVFDGLRYDIENHVKFANNLEYIDFKTDRDLDGCDSNKTNIIVASSQLTLRKDLEEKDSSEEIEEIRTDQFVNYIHKNLQCLNRFKYDMVIVDEYHYGASTDKFKAVLSKIDYSRLVYVSGTAMRDIAAGRFSAEQLFYWTYIDEQEKEKNTMPKMHLFGMCLDVNLVAQIKESFSVDEFPTMKKLFETKGGSFLHKGLVSQMLDQIIGTRASYTSASPFLMSGVNPPKHIFCVMPKSIASIKAFGAMIGEMYPDEFDVIIASGNEVTDVNTLYRSILASKNKNRKSITLSCSRFKEGVTILEWDSVIMLDDGESIVEYFQAIFRCQSGGEGKTDCYVFDYSPQRMLKMVFEMTEKQYGEDDTISHENIAKRFIACAPMVLAVSKNAFQPIDFKELLYNFNQSTNRNSGYVSFAYKDSFDTKRIVANIVNFERVDTANLKPMPISTSISDNELDGGKNFISTGRGSLGKEGQKEETEAKIIENIKNALTVILYKLPEYMFVSLEDEASLGDIIRTTSPESLIFFKELCCDDKFCKSLDDFKRFIDMQIFNKSLFERRIGTYRYAERELKNSLSSETYEKFRQLYFFERPKFHEDIKTPMPLARKMVESITDVDLWSSPNAKFCDVACKGVAFLLVIKEKLMCSLEGVIPDRKKRERHILDNMLYAYCHKYHQKQLVEEVVGANSDNIIVVDASNDDAIVNYFDKKENEKDMPRFDVVVMNPPYKDGLHLKFLEKAVKISTQYIVSVQPAQWILNEKPTKRNKVELFLIESVEKYNSHIEFIEGTDYFKVGMQTSLSINVINKQLKSGKLNVKYRSKMHSEEYARMADVSKYGYWSGYSKLKEKIQSKSSSDNVLSHINTEGNYYVNMPWSIGSSTNGETYAGTYIFLAQGYDFEEFCNNKRKTKSSEYLFFGFDTKDEAYNFYSYLKTWFARFALSIYKSNQNLNRGELGIVPWLNFKQEWTDEKLFEYFDITPEEQQFIYNTIPDFYGIRK